MEFRKTTMTLFVRQQKRHRQRTDFWTLWEKARVGFERIALTHAHYHMWNRSPVQVRCMKQGTQSRCTGTTLGDGMGREMGGGFRVGEHMYTLNRVSVRVFIMCFHSKLLFHNIYHYCRFISVFIIFVKCVCRLSGCKPHKDHGIFCPILCLWLSIQWLTQ